MPHSPGHRGSGGQPLLRDYLTANRQQGAQQAQGMANYLGQQQQAATTATNAAEQAVTQQRLQPAYGAIGQVGGTVPGVAGPATPSADMAKKALEAAPVELTDTEAGRAATAQAGRAATMGRLATTPEGMAAINAQRYGMAAPRTAGGSMLDAATTNYGGGGMVRQQARQGAGLRERLTGAAGRANAAAEAQARQWIAAGTPPPTDPTLTPPRAGSRPGRPPSVDGMGREPRLRDWVRERREENFGG